MAKIAFSKFGLKSNTEVKTVEWNGVNIEVIQYLPIQEKLGLIGRVVSQAHEQDGNYSNPVKIQVYTALEVLYSYTNISFTEKQREDTPKLYDLVYANGLLDVVIAAIPDKEYSTIVAGVHDSIEAIYKYQNSVLGIVSLLKDNLEEVDNIDIEGMRESVEELSNSPLVGSLLKLLAQNN